MLLTIGLCWAVRWVECAAMATNIQPRAGKHQLRVAHKLLPKPFFFTFLTLAEAESYRDALMALLARGVVPVEMLAKPKAPESPPSPACAVLRG